MSADGNQVHLIVAQHAPTQIRYAVIAAALADIGLTILAALYDTDSIEKAGRLDRRLAHPLQRPRRHSQRPGCKTGPII